MPTTIDITGDSKEIDLLAITFPLHPELGTMDLLEHIRLAFAVLKWNGGVLNDISEITVEDAQRILTLQAEHMVRVQ